MTRNVVFRIRRKYFDRIVSGRKQCEIRPDSPHWRKIVDQLCWSEALRGHVVRARNLHAVFRPEAVVAVFVCGKRIHRQYITKVRSHRDARAALGRMPSNQGLADLGTGPVYKFHLGGWALQKEMAP